MKCSAHIVGAALAVASLAMALPNMAAAQTGTSGPDTITGGPGPNVIDGLGGNDLLIGGPMNDVITPGPGFDTVSAGGGDDTIQVKRGTGPDSIDGGAGNDLLVADYMTQTVNLHLDVSQPAVSQSLGEGSTIVNIERLKIIGGSGADTFIGGALADSLTGGQGDDLLQGGGGNDQLNGGDGYDIAVYSGAHDQYTVTSLGAGTYTVSGASDGADTLTGVETLRFSDGDRPIGGYNASAVYWGSPNGTSQFISTTPVPDGRGAAPGTGFTDTGLAHAPDGGWWLANEGQADATDTTYTPSLVHLSTDFTTKLGEIPLGGHVRSLQGLAYDTKTNQLLVASLSEHIVRVVNLDGTLAQTITLPAGVSPNAVGYDPVLDAAIIGRSNGSTDPAVVEWRSVANGALIKSITLPLNVDHVFLDPNQGPQGTLYYSYGPSGVGAVGVVAETDVASGAQLGRWALPKADAIEGIYLSNGVLYANNDAFFHQGSNPVNSVLTFNVTPAAVIVDQSAATQSETVDLTQHSQTLPDGTQLVGVPRIFFRGGSGADVITGGAFNDVLVGATGGDTITGRGGDDRLVGSDGNDVLNGGAGNDDIEGGAGADTAVYSGPRSGYHVVQLGGSGALVTDTRPGAPDGVDKVSDVESFQFSDGTLTYAQTVSGP